MLLLTLFYKVEGSLGAHISGAGLESVIHSCDHSSRRPLCPHPHGRLILGRDMGVMSVRQVWVLLLLAGLSHRHIRCQSLDLVSLAHQVTLVIDLSSCQPTKSTNWSVIGITLTNIIRNEKDDIWVTATLPEASNRRGR
jgi:hypothetical protein